MLQYPLVIDAVKLVADSDGDIAHGRFHGEYSRLDLAMMGLAQADLQPASPVSKMAAGVNVVVGQLIVSVAFEAR